MKVILTILIWIIIILVIALGVKSIIGAINERRHGKKTKQQDKEQEIIIKENNEEKGE